MPAASSAEDRQKLASLGYVSATAAPVVRKDAPRPVDMVRLFDALEEASTLFVQAKYAQVIPLLERILAEDRYNLDATLRLATAHSALGHEAKALAAFRRAGELAPKSDDVRMYLALHYARGQGLGPGGARARADRGGIARAAARRGGPRASPGTAGQARRGRRPAAERLRAEDSDARRSWCGSARWRWKPARRTRPSTRSNARAVPRDRRSGTTWNSGCSTCRPAGSTTPARRSIACPRRTPRTRWRSSSARR